MCVYYCSILTHLLIESTMYCCSAFMMIDIVMHLQESEVIQNIILFYNNIPSEHNMHVDNYY